MIRWSSVIAASSALLVFGLLARPTGPAVAGGGGCNLPASDGRATTVDLESNCFVNTVVRINVGDTVTWTNRDTWAHSVTSAGANQPGSWGSFDELQHQDTVSQRFDASGVYPYFCVFHPGMVGAVVVGDGTSDGLTSAVEVAVDDALLVSDATSNSGGADVKTAASAPNDGGTTRFVIVFAIAAVALAAVTASVRHRRRARQ